MAFEKNKERYASFGVTTSLPHEIIDTFWDLLDHYPKNVVPLDPILTFRLANNHNNVTFEYHDSKRKIFIGFDYNFPFDPFFPEIVHIIDQAGVETLLLPHELD